MRLFADNVVLGDALRLEVVSALVTVDGSRITSVQRIERGDLPQDSDIVDLGSKCLAPAFVNAHTHLPMSAFRGLGGATAQQGNVVEELFFRVERALHPEDIRAFTRMGAYEVLLSGTGTVYEHYYGGDALLQGIRDVGLTAGVGFALQDLDGPGTQDLEAQLEATEQLACDASAAADGLVAMVAPHATDTVSGDLWDRVAALATRYDLPVHVHVAQSLEEVQRSHDRHGTSPMRYLQDGGWLDAGAHWLLVHNLYVSEGDLKGLDPERHTLVYCPYSQVQFEFPAHLQSWRAAGVPVAVATDAGACNDTMNVQQDLRLVPGGEAFATPHGEAHAKLRDSGTLAASKQVRWRRQRNHEVVEALSDPATLLGMVWDVPGRVHPQLPVGRIARGAFANLAVYDLSHPNLWPAADIPRAMAFNNIAPALWGVMVRGQWIGEPGDPHALLRTDAYRAHAAEAQERLQQVLYRAGLV